jgi:LacI family transcriptional regulator
MSSGDDKRVTSADIARLVGVSQPTVSRALRGDPRVAAGTTARIQEAATNLGYVPHAAARSLRSRRSGTVAVVLPDLDNPFYPELLDVLHSELDRLGLHAVLVSEKTQKIGDSVVSLLRSELVDGAIVATATLDPVTKDLLHDSLGPIVLIIRDVPGSGRDAVVADNAGGAAMAARYLLELGHRRIGAIMGPLDTWTSHQRMAGFREEMEQAGATRFERSGPYSPEAGYKACQELLAEDPPPTAVVCGNDAIALGVLDGARAAGVDVPGQFSIIGFDDLAISAWQSFRLTSVRQPLREMAAQAARMLSDTMAGKLVPTGERVEFPTELIVRGTTGPAPADPPTD